MQALIAILTTLKRGIRGVLTEVLAVTALFVLSVAIAFVVTAIF